MLEAAPAAERVIEAGHDYPTPPLGMEVIEAAFHAAATLESPPMAGDVLVVDDSNESPWIAAPELVEAEQATEATASAIDEPLVDLEAIEPLAMESPLEARDEELHTETVDASSAMLDDVLNDFVVGADERIRTPEPIPGFDSEAEAEEELQAMGGPQSAAGVLEAIARRIRGGEIVVAPPAAQNGEAAVLATVLAALLTKSD
jgi:hypothetical protein